MEDSDKFYKFEEHGRFDWPTLDVFSHFCSTFPLLFLNDLMTFHIVQ